MERYKIQMKAYKKSRLKIDSTPYLKSSDQIYVINTLDPCKKIRTVVVKTAVRNQRTIITAIECPECKNEIYWDGNWAAFTCPMHKKKTIYELV